MQEVVESIRIMGLNPATATMADIKSKYRSIALRNHPDKLLTTSSVHREAAARELHKAQSAYELLLNKFRERQAVLDEESQVYYADIGDGGIDGEGVKGTDVITTLRMRQAVNSSHKTSISQSYTQSQPVISSIPVDITPFNTQSEILRATTTSIGVLAPKYCLGERMNERIPFRRCWMEDMIRRTILHGKPTSKRKGKTNKKTEDHNTEKNKNCDMKKGTEEGEGVKENEMSSESEDDEERVDYSWGIRCRRTVPSKGVAGSEGTAEGTSSDIIWVRQPWLQYGKEWGRQLRSEVMILLGVIPSSGDEDRANTATQKKMNRRLFLPPYVLLICVGLMCALYEWCLLKLSGYY